MNLLGRAAQVYMPQWVRKVLLARLFADTAAAFGRPAPPLRRLSAQQTLERFAAFTAAAARDASASSAILWRLFQVARGYGGTLRRAFGVTSTEDAMAVACVVYGAIGIDFYGDARGEITITRCFFSKLYTPEVCRFMSALDAGLLAGLSGGGRFEFSRRITEGYPCCRAHLMLP